MLESFMVALRVAIPMGVLMLLGVGIRKGGIVDRPNMQAMDKVAFYVFLPALIFRNIYETDLASTFDIRLLLFATFCMMFMFAMGLLIPKRLEPDHNKAAAIGQAIAHPNYALFGIAVAEAIYGVGNAGQVALLGVLVIPSVCALGVVILELNRSGKADFGQIFRSIFKNPLVLGALAALALQALPFQIPQLVYGVVQSLAAVATPICFLSLGVNLDLGELRHNLRPIGLGVGIRMLLVPILLLPLGVLLGFRGQAMTALMILCAAPAAVASYPMAVSMGADGPLAGQLVYCTTIASVITIFCFTFVLRLLGML